MVNVEQDPYVLQLQPPANVLEVISVAMERVKVRTFLHVNVSTTSETVLIDVIVFLHYLFIFFCNYCVKMLLCAQIVDEQANSRVLDRRR